VETGLSSDSGESYCDRALLAFLAEDVRKTEVIQPLCAFAVSTAALGVDNSLGDSLSIEVGEEID
jgi:hypothetical protein